MDDLEKQLGAVLNDPQMMGKLMAAAQSLQSQLPKEGGGSPPAQPAQTQPAQAPSGLDLAALQKAAGMFQGGGIDKEQQALLKALSPYLSQGRLQKLERAMRAAKMAQMASNAQGFLRMGR